MGWRYHTAHSSLFSKRQNHEEDFLKFCVFLRKPELYNVVHVWFSFRKYFLVTKYTHKNCNSGPFLYKLRVTHFPIFERFCSQYPLINYLVMYLKIRTTTTRTVGKQHSIFKFPKKNSRKKYTTTD